MSSERTPLFHPATAQENSRLSKATVLAVGALGALATVGYYHHSALGPVELPVAAVSMDADSNFTISSSTPGSCKRTSDCAKFGNDYSCVALESNLPGLTLLSQCVKGAVCTGNVNGACPSFSSWSSKFRALQPVCAFSVVKNCDNALDANGTSINQADENKTVTCFAATFTNADGDSKDVNGIYKCVDAKVYVANKMGFLDFTPTQIKACAGNTSNSPLCNGHGTCAPTTQFNSTYGCKCNGGYSSDDNCYEPVGNVCDGFGQCGAMGSCDPKTGACVCKTGAIGDQCAKCDINATSDVVCSGRGTCGADATCQCGEGFEGFQCETRTQRSGGSSDTPSTETSQKSSSSSLALSTMAAFALAVVFATL